MALDPYSHGRAHVLSRWHETTSILACIKAVRLWALPREKGARAILKSIYYVTLTKIEILLYEWHFSPNNKDFFFINTFKKNFAHFPS